MTLNDFATSVAIKVNKEEDFGFIESLKFDILGYRASIIASMSNKELSDVFYQRLKNLTISKDYIEIPELLGFKDGSFKLNAVVRLENKFKLIPIITEENSSFVSGRKFSRQLPTLVLHDSKLYPINFAHNNIDNLFINGIFSNPIAVSKSTNCTVESKCIDNGDLTIEDSLYQKIIIFLYKQLGIENSNEILNSNN